MDTPQKILNTEYSTHVRLSEEQYLFLQKEQRITGKSIPTVLKERCFSKPLTKVLLSPEEQRVLLVELRRIGTNVNQIARRVNSGLREGWYEAMEKVAQDLSNVRQWIAGIYGSR